MKRFIFTLMLALIIPIAIVSCEDLSEAPSLPSRQPSPGFTRTASPLPPTPLPNPTETQTSQPLPPIVILVDTGNQYSITFVDAGCNFLTEVKAPNAFGLSVMSVFMAGEYDLADMPPVVSLAKETYSYTLSVSRGGSVSTIFQSLDLHRAIGAPGTDAIAFLDLDATDEGVNSHLYYGSLSNLTDLLARPIFSESLPDDMINSPLSIHLVNGAPTGILYTHENYGIGGDIVFPQRNGLFYFGLELGESRQLLDDDRNPVGISSDLEWIASTTRRSMDLRLHELDSGREIPLQINPASDRGAGLLIFNPDESRVAWMEGVGWKLADVPNFTTRVAAASLDGTILASFPADDFSFVSTDAVITARPVAFLDNDNLLIQVSTSSPDNNTHLVRLNLLDNSVDYFCQGVFLGIYYH